MATDEGINGLNYEHSVNLRGNKGQDYPSITISLERMSEKNIEDRQMNSVLACRTFTHEEA